MRCHVLVMGFLFLFPLVALGQSSAPKAKEKWPIPGKDAQAKIERLLQEIFAPELDKAEKDLAEKRRLAQKFLDEGKETKDDPAGRYVLFSKAHAYAAQAGDVQIALQAADELAQDFSIPSSEIFRMKIRMLQQASEAKNAPAEAYQSVIDRALLMLDDTLDSEDFASSLELLAAADQAARGMRSIPALASIRKKQEVVVRLQKEFARWQPYAEKLVKSPDDPEANLEMGKYQTLIKGNWERGLPLLAKGSKGSLQSLALADLNGPRTEGQRRIVALGWYTLADDPMTDPFLKTQALLRSYHWYQQNLFNANDEDRKLLEAKLQHISNLLPSDYRIGEIATELKRIDVSSGPVYGCAFSPDSKRFLITGYDGALHLYNTQTGKEIRQLDGHAGKVWTVAYFNNGARAVSGGFDSTVRLWDLTTGSNDKTLEGHKDYVRSVAVSADGQWVLSGSDDRTVRLWNAMTGKEQQTFIGHGHTVWSVDLSRDGTKALSGSLDKTVRLWDTKTGEQLKKLEGHKDTVLCVAFLPDGRHALSGSSDKTIRLWDLETGKSIHVFTGSGGYVLSLAVSPDGRRFLSAGQDNLVRLWDAATGKEIRQLEGHSDQVWHVAFSRDGRLALSSGQDNTVRIWSGSK